MHSELETIFNNNNLEFPIVNTVTLRNAETLLNYIEDINLERNGKFELTPDESLYLLWDVEESELHIECLKSGKILYTFRKYGISKACGSAAINDFIPLLENYLLTVIC